MEEAKFVQMFNIAKNNAFPIPRMVTAQTDKIEKKEENKIQTPIYR
jgi:hypothetical protein